MSTILNNVATSSGSTMPVEKRHLLGKFNPKHTMSCRIGTHMAIGLGETPSEAIMDMVSYGLETTVMNAVHSYGRFLGTVLDWKAGKDASLYELLRNAADYEYTIGFVSEDDNGLPTSHYPEAKDLGTVDRNEIVAVTINVFGDDRHVTLGFNIPGSDIDDQFAGHWFSYWDLDSETYISTRGRSWAELCKNVQFEALKYYIDRQIEK